MNKKNLKTLAKFFILFFAIAFLVLNWHQVELVFSYFDYKIVGARISDTFNPGEILDKYEIFTGRNEIRIPEVDIDAPLVFIQKNDIDFDKALERGVLYYPHSALPGEKGISILLGHSAPDNWPKNSYSSVFSNLNKLEKEDNIVIRFKGDLYSYKVTGKYILEKGEEIDKLNLSEEKSVLVLLSCWPPGENQRRIAVSAVLN